MSELKTARPVAAEWETLEPRRLLTSINGAIYNDHNYSGTHDSDEQFSTASATLYLDANSNDKLDAGEVSTVASDSVYSFANLQAGTYTIRAFAPVGYVLTDPAGGDSRTVTITDASPSVVSAPAFGIATAPPARSISGFLYSDADASGSLTASDTFGTFGSVFLDLNNDAVRESNEPAAVIANNYGEFTFTGLQPGTYTVRATENYYALLTPATQTYSVTLSQAPYPAVETSVTGLAFGFAKQSMSAAVYFYKDNNGNGTYDTGDTSLASGTGAYADLNNNGQRDPTEPVISGTGGYSAISGLPKGTITLRGLGGTNYTPVSTATFTLPSAAIPTVRLGFVTKGDVSTTISGSVFLDANNNGLKDSGEGTVNDSRPLPRVYADLNNNGTLDTNEPSTQVNSSGNYTLGVSAGTVTLRLLFDAQYYKQSAPVGGSRSVQAAVGTGVTGQDFGLAPFGAISGVMFNDTNRNGTLDTGDTGLNGYVVYVDANRNGQYDYGESSYTTLTLGSQAGYFNISGLLPGTYSLEQIVPSGYRQLAPATAGYTVTLTGNIAYVTFADTNAGGASISGTAYNDANTNGVKDSFEGGFQGISVWDDADNDGQIDSNEQQATTDASGNYTLRGLPAGTFYLRALFFNTHTPTSPGAAGNTVTLTTGQAKTGVNFGAKSFTPAYVSGYVFNDTNGNGSKDAGDTAVNGAIVYLDANKNGTLDSNEIVSQTDSTGYWSTQTTGDTGAVRYAFYNHNNRTLTTPAFIDITPHAGQSTSNVNFGIAPATTTFTPLHIDAGGPAAGAYSADSGFTGGTTYSSTAAINTSAVASPAPQAVYQTERYGNFSYNLAGLVAGKQYTVTLHFDELYWTAAGKRVFNVTGNGAAWLTNFDVFAAAGAKNKAITRSFSAFADTTGKITITFTGVKDNAKVNAIDVVANSYTQPLVPAATFINAGGGAIGQFSADTGYSGGKTYSTTATVDTSLRAAPAPAAAYQTERYGNFAYTLQNLVFGQHYLVELDFAETYWNAANQRLFNILINGQTLVTNYDIFVAAGGKNKASGQGFDLTPDSTGKITITFVSVKDNAKVSAIQVIPVPSSSP